MKKKQDKEPIEDLIEDISKKAGETGEETGEDSPKEQVPMTSEQERDDLLGRLQRLAADYQNYQKRTSRELAQSREFANEQIIKAMLIVIDDMERALEAAKKNHGEDDPLFVGMQMVHDKAMETLCNFGLSKIEAIGQPFDPDQHSAMMQQPTADHEHMTILTEVQKGYQLKGRTIRPSGVIVAVTPEETSEDDTDSSEE